MWTGQRHFAAIDAVNNFFVSRATNARSKVTRLYDTVRGFFGDVESSISPPSEPAQGVLVRAGVPVDLDRIDLETTEVEGPDGAPLPIALLRRGGQLLLEARSEVRQRIFREVRFRIQRAEFATQYAAAYLSIQPICLQEGTLLGGCVQAVVVTPPERQVAVGDGLTLTATLLDAGGNELTGRTVRWTSDAPEVVSVVAIGTGSTAQVTGLKAGGPVTITAAAGSPTATRQDTARITVSAPDETELYEAAVIGHWTATIAEDGTTRKFELFPGGTGVYRIPLPPPHTQCSASVYVDGFCEAPIRWTVSRGADGKYRMRETGYWHSAFDGGEVEPLSLPITTFRTYSAFDPGMVTRIYAR